MKFSTFLLLITLYSANVFSQATTSPTEKDTGKVTLIQDARVDLLVSKKTEINKKTNGKSSGYRVQIHFGGDSQEAKKIKSDFMTAYPEIPAYYIYEQPNFKIRVGDYKSKLEAQKFLKEIKASFPASFVVEDKVEMIKIY